MMVPQDQDSQLTPRHHIIVIAGTTLGALTNDLERRGVPISTVSVSRSIDEISVGIEHDSQAPDVL